MRLGLGAGESEGSRVGMRMMEEEKESAGLGEGLERGKRTKPKREADSRERFLETIVVLG